MRPDLLVLAGTNGAGKSSVAGAALRAMGVSYYDPDRATRHYEAAGLSLAEANSRAWLRGKVQLERAIRQGKSYALETPLGGRTITRLLLQADRTVHRVRLWYVGLASPELHIQRVRARVERGGHDIPEEKIRERWDSTRRNLVRLLPSLDELSLYDNSEEASMPAGAPPRPLRILHAKAGRITHMCDPTLIPEWSKPVVAAAIRTWAVPEA